MGIFRKKPEDAGDAGALASGYDEVDVRDRAVLEQLVSNGASLEVPREVRHYLYVSSAEDQADTGAEIQRLGFEVELQPALPEHPLDWLVLAQRDAVVLTAEEVAQTRRLFDDLATKHDGEYDGWEASP